jgi:hypothetical protein
MFILSLRDSDSLRSKGRCIVKMGSRQFVARRYGTDPILNHVIDQTAAAQRAITTLLRITTAVGTSDHPNREYGHRILSRGIQILAFAKGAFSQTRTSFEIPATYAGDWVADRRPESLYIGVNPYILML